MNAGEIAKTHVGIPGPASLVVLADVSGSMAGEKIQRLRRELTAVWSEVPGARLLSFSSDLRWIETPAQLPAPAGGTNLQGALLAAAEVLPGEVLVISDGLPDDRAGSLDAARKVPGTISVLFVGSDSDHHGAAFLQQLALLGGGLFARRDLAKHVSLTSDLRGLLALPSPPIAL